MSQPDLFVVCKNCGSEVSPYVTECPYCGQRVRKRAPKLDRSGGEPQPEARAGAARRCRACAPRRSPGSRPTRGPYATLRPDRWPALLSIARRASGRRTRRRPRRTSSCPVDDEVWRFFAAPFLFHDQLGYAVRGADGRGHLRHAARAPLRPVPVVVVFVLVGRGRHGARGRCSRRRRCSRHAVFPVLGANGAALGLLCAWLVDDRLAARRGDERDNDLLGVYVIAVVLVLLSLAEEAANIGAAVGGAAGGRAARPGAAAVHAQERV